MYVELKFDTSAHYKKIASYALTVNTRKYYLPEKATAQTACNQAAFA